MRQLPPLGKDATVRLSRQGGLAAMQALSRPREIDFASCDEQQRGQICSVLEGCLPLATSASGQGDRRYYQIELRYRKNERDDEMVLQIPEEQAPGELVLLWDKGEVL
ncbi:protealysin inhibitor emfourin [Pseudomonas sp. Q2-TVG4-2]|uniref:protealysin inhibitor emfourin n=1 Tax=Pseudomonas sp. Q2-TVG4-2 TaxID=1685699 RepID=UPI0015E7719E|nr:protealysin inhibitor emfourin [Pseudomonas sp. Q2-TVG4-2]